MRVFASYSHQDERLHDELLKHLSPLIREGLIEHWHDREITAGKEFGTEIDISLNSADLILLLVSPDFISSDYCWGKEMARALELHKAGEARVIPIILRPTDWQYSPFASLLALPTDGKAITTWTNRDEGLLSAARGIRAAVRELLSSESVAESGVEIPFNGVDFDSLVGAQWGVFFDAAGISYQYRPVEYQLRGVLFKPDFVLGFHSEMFFEIVPESICKKHRECAHQLAEQAHAMVLLCRGVPEGYGITVISANEDSEPGYWGTYHFSDDRRDEGVFWLANEDDSHVFSIGGPGQITTATLYYGPLV